MLIAWSALLTGACSSTTAFPGGPDGGTESGSVSNGIAALEAKSAVQAVGNTTIKPGAGSEFVVVTIALTNQTSADGLSLAAPLFGLATESGLQYNGDPRTSLVKDGCDARAMLTTGHSVECSVIFETPVDAGATRISYRLPDGTSISAPVNLVKCTRCAAVCVDLMTDPRNCGACGNDVGLLSCVGGKATCRLSAQQLCGRTCVDVSTNGDHCGMCDRRCTTGVCEGGKCYRKVDSRTRTSCAALCGMGTCRENVLTVWYTNSACGDRVAGPPTFTCSSVPPASITDSAGTCGVLTYVGIECQCGT